MVIYYHEFLNQKSKIAHKYIIYGQQRSLKIIYA